MGRDRFMGAVPAVPDSVDCVTASQKLFLGSKRYV